jgi:hypothetical protein
VRFNPRATYTTIFGDKRFPEFKFCSYQHDKDYVERKVSRREADRAFRYCMEKVCGACIDPRRARQLRISMRQRYFIVRKLGWLMWWT